MDSQPLDQDLNFIAQYSPRNGIKVSLFEFSEITKTCIIVCSLPSVYGHDGY